MSVVYCSPASQEDEGAPGTHVLVIGIGEYSHLAQGSGVLMEALGRLGQLDSPSKAAISVARWFIGDDQRTGFNDPDAPLATVELLVSPRSVFTSPDNGAIPLDAPTADTIANTFQTWLSRLQSHERNVGVFYFCGHGVHMQGDILLASDFGKNIVEPWTNAFNISDTIAAVRRAVAGPLYFFIDTCRESYRQKATVSARPLVRLQAPRGEGEGHMLILQGASPGGLAFTPTDALPFFTEALIKALSGAAYVRKNDSTLRVVTSSSLVETVPILLKQLLPTGTPAQSSHAVTHGQDRSFHVERLSQARDPTSGPPLPSSTDDKATQSRNSARQQYSVGGSHDFTRTASEDEACLNVDDYADVVADLFSQTRDELCFAIFGAWGRGKTFLAERIAKALSEKVPNCQVVRFSAWQFPTTPEVWVHLYETFADAAFNGSVLRRIPNIVRTGIAKNGYSGLLLCYAAVALGAVPIFSLVRGASELLFQAYLVLGVYGMIFLWTLFNGIKKTKSRLAQEYLTPDRHTEKLGLQATIGKDLRNLLAGWMPADGFSWVFLLGYWLTTACLAGAAILRLDGNASWPVWVRENTGLEIQAGGGPVSTAIAVILIIVSASLALAWLRFGGQRPPRALLIVDDLDRCHPDHLISVVESIKLLVEDPLISSRVQVLMLVEEEVLRHAILKKYGRLIPDSTEPLASSYDAPRLVRETCEKLFTAQLRLPQLSTQEVRDLVETFSGFRNSVSNELTEIERRSSQLRSQQDVPIPDRILISPGKPGRRLPISARVRMDTGDAAWIDEPQFPVYEQVDAESMAEKRKEAAHSRERLLQENAIRAQELQGFLPQSPLPAATAPALVENRTLTEDEVKAILKALFDEGIKLRNHLGPRTVRALLFRYQLARLILIRLGLPWTPADLANGLATEFMVAVETKKTVATEREFI